MLPKSLQKHLIVTGIHQNHRKIELQPTFHALGPAKAAALPAFHALSGADKTGCFSGKWKAPCWKAFIEAEEEVIRGLSVLSDECDSQRRDDGLNCEDCVSAVFTEDGYQYNKGAEMVAV